jgi:hypothetical protein
LVRLCFAGLVLFTLSTLLMHVVQADLSARDDALSYYMNGELGWVFGLGLVALGAGSIALVAAITGVLGVSGTRAGRWLLALWGIGAVIGGIFPPDPMGHWDQPPSISGMIHGGAAMVAFLAFPIAALLLSGPLGRFSGSAFLHRILTGTAVASLAALLIFFVCLAPVFSNRPPFLLGLVERVLIVSYMAWIGSAAFTIRKKL